MVVVFLQSPPPEIYTKLCYSFNLHYNMYDVEGDFNYGEEQKP